MLTTVAKAVMKSWPPTPQADDAMWQRYQDSSEEAKAAVELQSSQYRYDYEAEEDFFHKYFPATDTARFQGKHCLDLGCYTGGRLVYWMQRYGFRRGDGIDIFPEYERAGRRFAQSKGVAAEFTTGFAEALPYPDATFDFILSYDVIEHVRSVDDTLAECYRVLKLGGRLMCVFPTFYQPLESHLGNATMFPALQWMFPAKTLTQAYNAIMRDRGYGERPIQPWERLPSLNGITVKRFRKIVSGQPWVMRYWGTQPIFSDGRRAKLPVFRLLRSAFVIPARMPVLEELFLGRVCCELEKV